MTKSFAYFITVALAFCSASSVFVSCSEKEDPVTPTPTVTTVKLTTEYRSSKQGIRIFFTDVTDSLYVVLGYNTNQKASLQITPTSTSPDSLVTETISGITYLRLGLTDKTAVRDSLQIGNTIYTIEMPQGPGPEPEERWFKTRGLILGWSDVNKPAVIDYVDIAKTHGLTTFSIYGYTDLTAFAKKCTDAGIDIENEEHAVDILMPSSNFKEHPEYFHMSSSGNREIGNPCPSCKEGMDVVRANVPIFAKRKGGTNHRFYCWLYDGGETCHCDDCDGLSAADQALMIENAVIEELRKIDPEAQLAHLAYQDTWDAPTNVKPAEGVFLEFAPFWRNYTYPLSNSKAHGTTGITHGEYLAYLADNLKVFPRETAQVLEYWCDESPYCGWSYGNLKKLPWKNEVFLDDLETYASYGIHHVMCYAAYVGPKYVELFGQPQFIYDYADGLYNYVKE